MKKRLFIFALAAVISMSVVSLVGCGKNEVNHANAAVSASATPSEATKTEESTVNTTAPAQTQTTTSVATDTKTENKSADNKSAIKGTEATAPANNNSKTENNSKTSGSSQTQSSNKSTQSGSQTNNQSSKSTNKNASNNTNANNSSSSKSSSADQHAGKTWHEAVYKTVNHPAVTGERKVIDQPAYSYEEPVYETKLIAKCKDCGMDISSFGSNSERIAHANQHIDEGGDGGWYTATEQVQVGTKTVNVPEQSHYETKVIKEAWTEKVLVKEAGWY